MIILILFAFLGHQCVTSSPIPIGVTIGLSPYDHPVQSLYHAQNNYGQYVYGYATPTSAKSETKTADGVTHGGYSYIDSNGILQTVQYTADAIHGFRVAATNLPKDLPDVAYAKAQHFADFEAVRAEHAKIAAERAVPYFNPIAVPQGDFVQLPQPVQDLPEVVKARAEHLALVQQAQVPVQDLPEVAQARAEHLATVEATRARDAALLSPIPEQVSTVVPVSPSPHQIASPISQYQAQDISGQYSYGYVGPWSSKSETRSADGVTTGGYSYIDANGILQSVKYIADPIHGFRVAATNLPAAPKLAISNCCSRA